jgi:hypothetical protein
MFLNTLVVNWSLKSDIIVFIEDRILVGDSFPEEFDFEVV